MGDVGWMMLSKFEHMDKYKAHLLQSANHHSFLEKAFEFKYAGDTLFDAYLDNLEDKYGNKGRIQELGWFNGVNLLYAVAIENLIKCVVIKTMKKNGAQYNSFSDIAKEWNKKIKIHKVLDLLECYNLKLDTKEEEIVKKYQPFMSGSGRFAYPKSEEEIKSIADNGRPGIVNSKENEIIHEFFEKILTQFDEKAPV
ncbi:MAG: hypothetical protein CVU11_14145 [Bacteroidetes bacterium HGW-Bacteroidetes-6]|nr:MAG: hypothetical protein CVU11_14145 [Bacteroidetes bacterium HGW-Bacteroidetes-6]